jgi:hypothetical protein
MQYGIKICNEKLWKRIIVIFIPTDPDPVLFFRGFQDANKNFVFSLVFCLILTGTVGPFYIGLQC